jgi:hypothetical protein
MSPYAEAMLIAELWKHREWDRSVPYSPAAPGGSSKTAAQIAELAAQIAADGVTEPLILHYDPWTRRRCSARVTTGSGSPPRPGRRPSRLWPPTSRATWTTAAAGPSCQGNHGCSRRCRTVISRQCSARRWCSPPAYFPGPVRWLVPLLDYEPSLAPA